LKSIRNTLLLWLAIGLTGGILLAGGALYYQARTEADALFDYQMQQISASLPREAFAPIAPGREDPLNPGNDILIQIWDNSGTVIYHSHSRNALPQRAELGFADIQRPDGLWRVYSAQIGATVVQIGQPQSARHEIAAQMAVKTVAPLMLFFPFLGLLIWIAVSRGLAPVKRTANDVLARDARQLTPISEEGLPNEIRPLTGALNDLLSRLDQAMNAQRAFVADAAHELRTPLTALRLQLQLAERADTQAQREQAFANLKKGIDRSTHLLQQLLTLARQEPGAETGPSSEIDLTALCREAVADFSVVADAGGVDLGLATQAAMPIRGNPDALRVLLNNLIDNALQHSPPGGRVDVAVQDDGEGRVLSVQDSGPGIPEAELERVFDRFYRGEGSQARTGSGLGLAIVQSIASAHGAQVWLRNTPAGLKAYVRFPYLD
jgi:two-component system OmpR family sensor kinase